MIVRSLVFAAVIAASVPAGATTIIDLYNTGVNDSHVVTTGNAADTHWALAGGTAYTGGTNNTFPIGPWVFDDASSRWITPTGNAGDETAIATYSFSTTFDLTGFRLSDASIGGTFAADDSATIFLNGVQIGSGGGYTSMAAFGASSGFLAGINTLLFDVLNSGAGPTGLKVVVSGVAFVPEPATWGMMLAGFAMVGFTARRRRTTVAA